MELFDVVTHCEVGWKHKLLSSPPLWKQLQHFTDVGRIQVSKENLQHLKNKLFLKQRNKVSLFSFNTFLDLYYPLLPFPFPRKFPLIIPLMETLVSDHWAVDTGIVCGHALNKKPKGSLAEKFGKARMPF